MNAIDEIACCNPSTARQQQRYDHRLSELVRRSGDVTIATDLGVPRSTARGWLRRTPPIVVSLDVTRLSEQELHHEVVRLRRRVEKLAALLRLVLAVMRASGFTLSSERLPDGRDKRRILRAIEQARACIPVRGLLRILDLSPSRFQAGRVCPGRSVVVSPDVAASPDTGRGAGDRGDGDVAGIPPRPDRHARRARAAAGPRVGVAVDVVSARAQVWLAAPEAACASREAQRWDFARRAPTKCGTSTPPSFGSSTAPVRISMR